MAVETLFGGTQTFVMLHDGVAIFRASAKHVYNNVSMPRTWSMMLTVDGTQVKADGGSGVGTELPFVEHFMALKAGNHTVAFQWYGDSTMQLTNIFGLIDRRYA